jgi:hypothetical protein
LAGTGSDGVNDLFPGCFDGNLHQDLGRLSFGCESGDPMLYGTLLGTYTTADDWYDSSTAFTGQITQEQSPPLGAVQHATLNFAKGQRVVNTEEVSLQVPSLPQDLVDTLYGPAFILQTLLILMIVQDFDHFGTSQRTCLLINQQEFLSQMMQDTSSYDMVAAQYAVWAHAVPACPKFAAWRVSNLATCAPDADYGGFFYRQARFALDQCDLEQRSGIPSLRALQATILIGLCEL